MTLNGNAPETIEVNGVWYDRRDTVDALTSLLAEARTKIATYKDVIRGYREKELSVNPTPPAKTHAATNLILAKLLETATNGPWIGEGGYDRAQREYMAELDHQYCAGQLIEREMVEIIYGLLWSMDIPTAARSGRAASRARAIALGMIDKEGQARGIQAARDALATEPAFGPGELQMHSCEIKANKAVRNSR